MDIYPFSLPNCDPGEVWFEEARDIREVVVTFDGGVPRELGLSYQRKVWPRIRFEQAKDTGNPFSFGWSAMDDWFNGTWQKAAVVVSRQGTGKAILTFRGLAAELGRKDAGDYDVPFRRTLALRIDTPRPERIRRIEVYTTSSTAHSAIRVELDAGRKTRGRNLSLSCYNGEVDTISAKRGLKAHGADLSLGRGIRSFEATVKHMRPAHRYCGDRALLTFHLDHETFTIRLDDLAEQGPIWYAEEGVYIACADDPGDFESYRRANKGRRTIAERVKALPEQTYGGAFNGQPRPHVASYSLGCRHARQRFWLEANGDLVLHKRNVTWVEGKDTPRFKSKATARFFFDLGSWEITGRFNDPAPVLVYNIHGKRGNVLLEQKSLAVPLLQGILDGELAGDDPTVALLRFRFRNAGDSPAVAELPLGYSQDSRRSWNGYHLRTDQDENLVPKSPRDTLNARGGRITSPYRGKPVLRCTYETTMRAGRRDGDVVFTQRLAPGEICELLLKVPYIALEARKELSALGRLQFERCLKEVTTFWRRDNARGSQLRTPNDHLNAAYAAHLSHVEISDFAMPDDPDLVNTSVGTSTYGNFTNESAMIVQELEQRGLVEDCRRRIDVWIKYQGTVPQPGNFTDYDGMYYGAGGYECGHYNQHHGWALWAIAEHYLITGDRAWFERVADSLIAGADWVFRQRKNTMKPLPHSRGWEQGFLPAGSLEDVTDFYYWLSTNSLTWRGTDSAAAALEAAGHTEAARVRKEADAYRHDLIAGFEIMRRHSPLVRLRDGRWVPHHPSRLYCRGRDIGWIREVLEGSVYLLISGLYDANSKAGGWILDDYHDNRYIEPPYGYPIVDVEDNFFHVGGLSCQPNLLAGLMPHLDRDEPEVYLWMLFNAWCSCYREEINGMIEHPAPVLGFGNAAQFKTSDEANAIMWLRYLLVYPTADALYLGRAMPRAWMAGREEVAITAVATRFGTVDVAYRPDPAKKTIACSATLKRKRETAPARFAVRFRTPGGERLRSVTVNGRRVRDYDAAKGDVDLSGLSGKITIVAKYA